MSQSYPLFSSLHHRIALSAALLAAVAAPLLSGCRVSTDNKGKNEDVRIATPFGNMQVKTNDKADATGLPLYPGATALRKDNGDDDGAANVNMSFGDFKLRVKAASYSTPDSPDTVLAYYRPKLGTYGSVIECNHGKLVAGTITPDSPSCSEQSANGVDVGDDKSHELRVGSRQHQRIVGVQTKDGSTKLALIVLDLPGGFGKDSDKAQ